MSIATISAPPVRALVRKELREYRHHRMILVSAVALPLLFLMLPMVNLVFLPHDTTAEGLDLAMAQTMFCFFLIPVIVPATMAAYAVIGEREQGTLEPMLTLPMTDAQFLAGKVISIAGPATLISWSLFASYLVLTLALVDGPARGAALHTDWMLWMPGLALPLALFSTLIGMIVSARSRDIRVAEQLAGLVLFPALAPILVVSGRLIELNLGSWLVALAVLVVLDVLLLQVTRRLFVRERAILSAG